MNWKDEPNQSKSYPYIVYYETRGFSLWVNNGKGYQVLGREYKSRQSAKDAAEQHKLRQSVRQTG